MIPREAQQIVAARLAKFDSVALLGPRQVGKTTLAREILAGHDGPCRYLDLENPRDRRLLEDPMAWFSAHPGHLIVLDEVQRTPEIFPVLRVQIDERRRMRGEGGKFLILGSASMDLLRQSRESLAGRISYVELHGLNAREVAAAAAGKAAASPPRTFDRLWLQGGFPPAYLREDLSESLQWREDFIKTYLERDLPRFGLRIAEDHLARFWRMLANDQGELFNAARYARSLGASAPTVSRYLDISHKLLLARVLRPWHSNTGKRLVKSPRFYIRDSGIVHALLNLRSLDDVRAHGVSGKSWEGFVIENLLAAVPSGVSPWFYRSGSGAEADLVLEFSPGRCWAFEIKLSTAPKADRGFHFAAQDIKAERRILVYPGEDRFPLPGGIEAMPLLDAMGELPASGRICAAGKP